jgi:hypothetical protein
VNRLAEIDETGAQTRRTAMFEGVVNDRRDANKASRDLQHDITIKKIDFSNSKALAGIQHTYKLSEDQADTLNKAVAEAKTNGQQVDRAVFSKDGQLQLIMKNGDVVSKGPAGAYNPSGADAGDLGDYLNSGGTASGSAVSGGIAPRSSLHATAPTPPANVPNPGKAAALAAAGNAYAAASQNPDAYRQRYPGMFDGQGNLLPKDQIISRINQTYGG